jgi:hypothetical protein
MTSAAVLVACITALAGHLITSRSRAKGVRRSSGAQRRRPPPPILDSKGNVGTEEEDDQ